MKSLIQINIDGKGVNRTLLTLVLVLLIGLPVFVFAGNVPAFTAFQNGEIIDAGDLNAKFEALRVAVNDNDTRIGTIETKGSTAGVRLDGSVTLSSGTLTAVPLGESFDSANLGQIVGNDFEFAVAGRYLITIFSEVAGNAPHLTVPLKNGGGVVTFNSSGIPQDNTVAVSYTAAVGDKFGVQLQHDQGSTLNSGILVTLIRFD